MKISEFLFNTGIIHQVQKPSRYLGGEYNQINKENSKVKIGLCFPDIYDIGMSHTGFHILYQLFNEDKDIYAQRVFLPWKDMIEKMEEYKIPLFSLEKLEPINNFDMLAITLQYELSFTNVLKLLDLANIPIYSYERTNEDPIIMAGGPCTTNPEPIADFIDVFFIGDGETVIDDINKILKSNKTRDEKLIDFSKIEGFYVPKFYTLKNTKKDIKISVPISDSFPKRVKAKKVKDFKDHEIPINQIVPNIDIVHKRAVIEIMRGCNRGCRFCHAGMFYRPSRERDSKYLSDKIIEVLENTGYNEVSLLSLSTLDYSNLDDIIDSILPYLEENKIGISLPSSRVDKFGIDISSKLQTGRKSGLTFAPEAGSQRMRDLINKGIDEDEILNVVSIAKENGWNNVKLYFMMGLPEESDDDIEQIVQIARKIKNKSKIKDITVNVSIFVPKSHTPFQYAPFLDMESIKRRIKIIKKLRKYKIRYNIHEPYESYLEAIVARGDRDIGKLIYDVTFNENGYLQQNEEEFNFRAWARSMNRLGLNCIKYIEEYETDDDLPWNIIDTLISEEFLKSEWKKSKELILTPDCRWDKCSSCGVCINTDYKIIKKTGS